MRPISKSAGFQRQQHLSHAADVKGACCEEQSVGHSASEKSLETHHRVWHFVRSRVTRQYAQWLLILSSPINNYRPQDNIDPMELHLNVV